MLCLMLTQSRKYGSAWQVVMGGDSPHNTATLHAAHRALNINAVHALAVCAVWRPALGPGAAVRERGGTLSGGASS